MQFDQSQLIPITALQSEAMSDPLYIEPEHIMKFLTKNKRYGVLSTDNGEAIVTQSGCYIALKLLKEVKPQRSRKHRRGG